ncbi:MAG: regulatory iron-sulfur-containing complex subunit RicT [Bacteroidetes bacterium]|nr:regulatory iron-sulfur-containing complex subunit RicT [Bacteroidota bacterium]
METSDNSSSQNPFFSRGCCQTPKIYHKNEGVFKHSCSKFDSFDWLKSIPLPQDSKLFDIIEVRFKNSRKDFFRIPPDMDIEIGEILAVEASPGHDIVIVTLTGEAVRFQMKKKKLDPASSELKKVYRRARLTDIEKWVAAVETEGITMHKAREIATRLNLSMKINDVEYQGDNTKAIFYYTADDRVDFRELIKILADEFKVRIEMRQIGARQEASRLGGIGSCGRELCCSTWLNDFRSVTTQAARVQQLSLNPQKLAGQCGKLKCCLNYEFETYVDALKDFPNEEVVLKTQKGEAVHQKTDIFKKLMWYTYITDPGNFMAIPVDSVRKIIEDNKNGIFPEKIEEFAFISEPKTDFENVVGQDDLTRFDNL